MYTDKFVPQMQPICIPGQIPLCSQSQPYFFDLIEDLSAFLGGPLICSSNWYDNHIRVADARIGYFLDISTNPSQYVGGTAEMCNADYNLAGSNRTTIGFTIFTYLRKEFDAYWGVIRTAVDRTLYGSLGQVAVRDMIGSRFPSLVNAYRTLVLEYVSLISRTDSNTVRVLPLYTMIKEDIVFKVQIRLKVDDQYQDPVLFNLDTKEQSVPIGGSHTGDYSVVSDNQLFSIRGIEQLGETMMWLGPETLYTLDGLMHNSFGPTVLVDFADHELCDGGADQRANCMNYIELRVADLATGYPFGEGMPFNLSTWSVSEGHPVFEPRYATSPSARLIKFDIDSGTCLPQQLDPVTMTFSPAGPFRTMCNIRNNFNVPASFDSGQVSFFAREPWTYDFNFDWTGTIFLFCVFFLFLIIFLFFLGTKVEELSITRCPDSAEVLANGTYVLLRSSSPIDVKISICTATNDCVPMGDTISISGSYLLPNTVINVQRYFQAWPSTDLLPTPSNRCYGQSGGLGIPVLIDRNYTYVSGLPNNVEASVLQILTPSQIQMQNIFSAMLQFHQATTLLATDLYNDDLPAILDQIINDARVALGNVSQIADDPVLDALRQQTQDLFDRTAKIMNDAAANAQTAADNALQQIMIGLNLNNVSDALIARIINDTRLLNNLTNALVDQMNQLGSPFRISLGNFIQGLIDAALALAKGIIGGIGGLLGLGGNILEWIKDVILIVIVCCLIVGVCVFIKKIRPMLKDKESGNYKKLNEEKE